MGLHAGAAASRRGVDGWSSSGRQPWHRRRGRARRARRASDERPGRPSRGRGCAAVRRRVARPAAVRRPHAAWPPPCASGSTTPRPVWPRACARRAPARNDRSGTTWSSSRCRCWCSPGSTTPSSPPSPPRWARPSGRTPRRLVPRAGHTAHRREPRRRRVDHPPLAAHPPRLTRRPCRQPSVSSVGPRRRDTERGVGAGGVRPRRTARAAKSTPKTSCTRPVSPSTGMRAVPFAPCSTSSTGLLTRITAMSADRRERPTREPGQERHRHERHEHQHGVEDPGAADRPGARRGCACPRPCRRGCRAGCSPRAAPRRGSPTGTEASSVSGGDLLDLHERRPRVATTPKNTKTNTSPSPA